MKIKKQFTPFEIHVETQKDLDFLHAVLDAAWELGLNKYARRDTSFQEQIMLFRKDLQK